MISIFKRCQKFTNIHWCPLQLLHTSQKCTKTAKQIFVCYMNRVPNCPLTGQSLCSEQQLTQKLTTDQSDGVVSHKRHTWVMPLLSRLRSHCGRGGGEAQDKIMSSGHDGTIVLKNSQQLWLPAQNLHKMKPINISAWRGQALGLPPTAKELLTVVLGQGNATPGRSIMLKWLTPYPWAYGQHRWD